ncbi:MAG: pyridoxal phosphate-dependent aminotransferase [Chloroflexota bacterium]
MRRQGVDVVDFGPGEPDFVTPRHIRDAAVQALNDGMTHYAPGRGIPDLRAAIARKLERDNDLHYNADAEVIVTPGAKQAIVETMLTAVAPGNEVVIFDPAWGSYDAIVRLAGGVPVHVQLEDDFSIDESRLRAVISERTRVIILGSPGNPTGHVASVDELRILADLCRQNDMLLVSDEIYERIVYDGHRAVSPATLPGMWERTVTINGLSKAYAMTGWRLGYVAAPEAFMGQLLKVHEHTVTTATTFAQVGAVAALDGPSEPIEAMVKEFERRRSIVVEGLNALPGVTCSPPDGAFYVFPNTSGTGLQGSPLADRLLNFGVAVTPGRGFGDDWDTHVRLSYATSEERIRTGLERMRDALRSL